MSKHDLECLACLCSLKELAEFIKSTDSGLQKEVKEGDYEGLVFVMGHLFAVKERQAATDEMFEPLKQTIELLKAYDQEMPEEVHMQLQVGINECKRACVGDGEGCVCVILFFF